MYKNTKQTASGQALFTWNWAVFCLHESVPCLIFTLNETLAQIKITLLEKYKHKFVKHWLFSGVSVRNAKQFHSGPNFVYMKLGMFLFTWSSSLSNLHSLLNLRRSFSTFPISNWEVYTTIFLHTDYALQLGANSEDKVVDFICMRWESLTPTVTVHSAVSGSRYRVRHKHRQSNKVTRPRCLMMVSDEQDPF